MKVSADEERRRVEYMNIGQYKFQGVPDFSYLGTLLNKENKITN